MSLPWLISQGFTTLSTLLTPTPQISMKIPQPNAPLLNNHSAAGSQINGGPTGTTDRKNVNSARSPDSGTPAMRKPIPAMRPCTNAVPNECRTPRPNRAAGNFEQLFTPFAGDPLNADYS